MPHIPEAPGVTDADRASCRTLIEAAGFHMVDCEEDGAVWERMVEDGQCLVLRVGEKCPFGKPERREWTLARYNKNGSLGYFTSPKTLADALLHASTFAAPRPFPPAKP